MGSGAKLSIEQTQRSQGKDLRFEVEVSQADKGTEPPDFRGPAVQGKRGERFIYIGIGSYAGQAHAPWSGRLKIPLTGIPADAKALEARVPGTARDGRPTFATVKPFGGWNPA